MSHMSLSVLLGSLGAPCSAVHLCGRLRCAPRLQVVVVRIMALLIMALLIMALLNHGPTDHGPTDHGPADHHAPTDGTAVDRVKQ